MKASDNAFPKVILVEGSAPATPASGQVKVYAKGDGNVYSMDDTGAETPLGGGGSSTIEIVSSIVSGTITPTGTTDLVRPATLTAALTIANPSSTPMDGAGFVLDLIDDGTSRALSWGTKYANRMATLPTATTAGKRHRIGVEYNAADDKLYCMYAQVQP